MKKVRIENECVCCDLPCMGESCPNRHVEYVTFTCDVCGKEFEADELYDFDGDRMMCADCLLEQFDKIED